jgi:hypothetical protein
MIQKLSRDELVERVRRLLSGEWDDNEMERLFSEIAANVPCPFAEIQGYVFHSDELSPEEMVEKMLAYESTKLPPPEK